MLEKLNSVVDLRKMDIKDLPALAKDLREYIIGVISENGGHLASSLGVVELTIALHYSFKTPEDVLIWDVGHQSYAHKILTGRKNDFCTVRKFKGISGFPKASESKFDSYNTGHSSTSLSLALGETVARDLKKKSNKVIAIIGDGSMTGGMAFEALNQIGHLQKDLIIILNDNEQSISKNVGALSQYLTRMISGKFYNKVRRKSYKLLKHIPIIGLKIKNFFTRNELNLKSFFVPGMLFEDLGIRYFGPVDGHNIKELISLFDRIKSINSGPKLIHLITKKGMGYQKAECNPCKFHGVSPFNVDTGKSIKKSNTTYSNLTGDILVRLAKKDKKIIALTAAMTSGTGLDDFSEKYPGRFFDVGIAEQHMVTFSSAMAKQGLKPYIFVYSTFLQRAYDQLIHDVAIMNLPVKILIDRAGIVGADGETHHGLFDISFIKNIPNFVFLSPSNGIELRDMLFYANDYNEGPIAIRYPRGAIVEDKIDMEKFNKFTPGKIKVLSKGKDLSIIAVGDMVQTALKIKDLLKDKISINVINLMSIKPLDIKGIENNLKQVDFFITIENGYIKGGVGEQISHDIDNSLKPKFLFSVGFPDEFILQGTNSELFDYYGLSPEKISAKILSKIKHVKENKIR